MEWLSYISQGVYRVSGPFHPFGGAVDIIVVQQPDGSFKSSPWYVKFGKFQGVLKTKEKVVNLCVNGVEADFHMYLNHKGEAYFLKEVDAEGGDSLVLSSLSSSDETEEQSQTGTIKKSSSSSSDEIEEQSQTGTIKKSKSCDFDDNEKKLVTQIDVGSRKIVARTNSRRSRIFGLMFGRKSMKGDSRQGEGEEEGAGVERASSLERAEIAADLLESKWSTNLPTGRSRRDNASRLSASNMPTKEAEKDVEGSDEQGLARMLAHDNVDNSFDCPIFPEETSPSSGEIGESYGSGLRKMECSEEFSSTAPCLSSQEQDTETSALEAHVLEETNIDFLSQNQCLKLEGGSSVTYDKEQESDERVVLLNDGASEKESGTYFIDHETSESSIIGVDGSGEQGLETLYFSHGECVVQVRTEFLCGTLELISEVNSQPDTKSEQNSVNADTKSITMESQSTFDLRLATSGSVEADTLEVIHQETITESLFQENCLEKEPVDLSENQTQTMELSYSCMPDCREVGLEEPSTEPGSYVQMVNADSFLGLDEESESHGVCIFSSPSDTLHLVQQEESLGEESDKDNLLPSLEFSGDPQGSGIAYLPTKVTVSSIPPSESSEEDQFHFSDIDDFVPSRVECKDLISPDSLEIENHPLVTLDDIEDMHGSNDMNHEPSSSSVKHVQECSPNVFDPLIEESRTTSSPICIPTRQKGAMKEVEWMVESLPNFRSHIDNMEMSDVLHPLSHSLDFDSENLKWGSLRTDVSSSLNSDSDSKHQLVKEHPRVEDTRSLELKNIPTNTTVEISLCRDFLYEGMGAEAASKAFDSEKVDLEKFVSLGPALLKNDKLVIRIGGCYFPWDAAAPIILGMVSFGREQILEPVGKISVDRVEKTFEGDPSIAIARSSGSWRLWPFSFKRSRTMSPVQPAPDGSKDSNTENASESTSDATGDKNVYKIKVAKKKVKEIVPTSEQLAKLNLKEGQNVITFTFSTSVLGKQQVDARIYMWKWNTQIVISDVDGTITKSDVLGQFMPLVGRDWSQTGVAHLFSAIKDNGYQLLFLSARAISQAYLTRQFLFNLKQDGKALPDGPVVISPDGLFPSLFREVIRRAPHEFKIACLKDIRALFPPDCNPFYAGFGNRDTDEISYLKVGIPKGKIFIINTKGEVVVNRWNDRKSYTSLHVLVNGMFPAMSSAEQEEFNSWNYWRVPLPDIDT